MAAYACEFTVFGQISVTPHYVYLARIYVDDLTAAEAAAVDYLVQWKLCAARREPQFARGRPGQRRLRFSIRLLEKSLHLFEEGINDDA